jgi:pSer/pThr/pTyr-binding forkhead associated (FHA) protein
VASLFVIQGADKGKRFVVADRPIGIGREAANPVRLHDNEVSRKHAEVRRDGEGCRIVDLGSANGTYLNGQPVEAALLRSGDQVRLGQTVILFDDSPPPTTRELTARVD